MKTTYEFTAYMRKELGIGTDASGSIFGHIYDKMDADQAARNKAVAEGRNGRWSSDITDSDRGAAALINAFIADQKGPRGDPRQSPVMARMKACNPADTGALFTAQFSVLHKQDWAAAIGVDDIAFELLCHELCKGPLLLLKRRKCVLSTVQHRVLLLALTDLASHFPELEDRVLEWTDANSDVNRDELRQLFVTLGGEDSCQDLAAKLKPRIRYRPRSTFAF
jgi:hypothetical protein